MISRIFVALKSYAFGSQRVIPSLDGLRAISICLVLLGHLGGTRGFPFTFGGLPLGIFGVRVFFVISGFLITSILIKELEQTGHISLPRFYFRRTMRLFPASYFLIAIVALLTYQRVVTLARWDLIFAVTYSMNFYENRGWPLGHLWSLAVEEQFYLVWPLTLRILGRARAIRFLIVVLAIAPLLRLASVYVVPAFNFVVWSDALGTGCLLALLRRDLAENPTYASLLRSRWFFLVPIAAFAASMIPSTKLEWLFGETIMNVCIAISADWAMRNANSAFGRFLNWPFISFIGVLSYSLYLWQQPFLNRTAGAWFCAFPMNIVLAFATALGSYLLVESPFLRMRATIERAMPKRRSAPAPETMRP